MLCTHGTLNFILLTDTSTDAGSMLGTVAALAVLVAIVAITLLGLLVTIFVIVKRKLKTVHSGENQFTNLRYSSSPRAT